MHVTAPPGRNTKACLLARLSAIPSTGGDHLDPDVDLLAGLIRRRLA